MADLTALKAIKDVIGIATNLQELFGPDRLSEISSRLNELIQKTDQLLKDVDGIRQTQVNSFLTPIQADMRNAIDNLVLGNDDLALEQSARALSQIMLFIANDQQNAIEKSALIPTLMGAINVRRTVIDEAGRGEFARFATEDGQSNPYGELLADAARVLLDAREVYKQEFIELIEVGVRSKNFPENINSFINRDEEVATIELFFRIASEPDQSYTLNWSANAPDFAAPQSGFIDDVNSRGWGVPGPISFFVLYEPYGNNIDPVEDWTIDGYRIRYGFGFGIAEDVLVPDTGSLLDVSIPELKAAIASGDLKPVYEYINESFGENLLLDQLDLGIQPVIDRLYELNGGPEIDALATDTLVGLTGGAFITPPDGDTSADDILFSNDDPTYFFGDVLKGGRGNDVLTGGRGPDSLQGEEDNDILFGEGGNDQLFGGPGDDLLFGGTGNNRINGGSGIDRVQYSNLGIGVTVDLDKRDEQFTGNSRDTITGVENLTGGRFDDTLYGDDQDNVIDGRNGNDTIRGRDGDDTIIGGGGDDELFGGNGIDTAQYNTSTRVVVDLPIDYAFVENEGTDTLIGFENITTGAGDDFVRGDEQNNVIRAGDGDDILDGKEGDDTLFGGAGEDEIRAGTGINTVWGGEGQDSVVFTGNFDDYLLSFAGTAIRVRDADEQTDVNEVENFVFAGQNTSLFEIRALLGPADQGNVVGGEGPPYDGTDERDVFGGRDEGDTYDMMDGNDEVSAQGGDDIIDGGGGDDNLNGEDGDDTIDGGLGDDSLYGGAGMDTLRGGDGQDELFGEDGGDTLDGDLGDDSLLGGAGMDTLRGGAGQDALSGDEGDDMLDGGAGDDDLNGGSGKDTMNGAAGKDKLLGGASKDKLYGGSGKDVLKGGGGNDKLYGEKGNDKLSGGKGADDFVFKGKFGKDVITDFNALSGKEDIDLSGVKQIESFSDLTNNHMSEMGDDVFIRAGLNSIRLKNVDIADLGVDDFIF